jgi:hypothetical protein
MGNGKSGDNPLGYDGHAPRVPAQPKVPITGEYLVDAIANGKRVMPLFAEEAAREILSFATPDEVAELARLLETLYNEYPDRHPAERVRAVRELRDRFRARRESGGPAGPG